MKDKNKKWICVALAIAVTVLFPVNAFAQRDIFNPDVAINTTSPQYDVIEDIEVTGLKRIEKDTVLTYLTLREGDKFDPAEVNRSLKGLFSTGLFADVSLIKHGNTLVVDVVENPIINRIAFEGNEAIEDTALKAEIQLRPRVVYTRTKVQEDVSRILQIYRRSGRFSASVDPKIVVLDQNRVNLVFEVNEGPKTYVQSINFVGNEKYDDDDLQNVIATKESRWYRFITSSDTYDPDRVAYDSELLRRFYLSKGYADFKVESVSAELSPDQKDFFITYTLFEGERYKFGDISIDNNLKGIDKSALEQNILTQSGEWYNADLVEETVLEMTDAAANMQYGFVDIRPELDLNRAENKVNLVYKIAESPRIFVERINIKGNVRTLDKVIRREFLLAEGDPYNLSKIKKSEQRIRDLDFFETVKVDTKRGSLPDRSVIDVEVTEKSTGELSIGAGFSTEDGALADLRIRERNLMGKGQDLLLATTISGRTQQFDVRFTEPYFLERELLAGIDLFHVTRDLQDESSFDLKKTGGGVRLGYPLSRHWRQDLRYNILENEIRNVESDASTYIKQQEGKRLTSKVGQEIAYDTRDSRLEPTEGFIVSLANDIAGIGGDARFIANELKGATYHELYENWILSLSAEAGYIFGLGQDVNIADRYFVGGTQLRGFETAGIGPRDGTTLDALGGNRYVTGTAELSFPLGLGEELGFNGHLFSDVGTLGDVDDDGSNVLKEESIRLSTGFGLSWKSPIGPIRMDVAFPIMKEDYDKKEQFRFSFGTRF